MRKTKHRISAADKAAHLIDLFSKQDVQIHNWLKTLFAIEAGLAAAFAFLLKDFFLPSTSISPYLTIILLSIIPVMGAVLSLLIEVFVIRELKWQRWYSDSYNELSSWDEVVFPSETKKRLEPHEQPRGWFGRRIVLLCRSLAALCVFVGAAALVFH